MKPSRPSKAVRRGQKSGGARPRGGRALSVSLIFCAVWLAVSFFCRFLGGSVGFLGELMLTLASGLLGRVCWLLPAALLSLAFARRRRVCTSLVCASLALLSAFADGGCGLAEAWSSGTSLSGGGALGLLTRSLLAALGGSIGPPLALLGLILVYLFVFLELAPRKLLSLLRRPAAAMRRLWAHRTNTHRKEDAMFKFSKRKTPIVIDDGGYYPVGDSSESFSQVRARLEKEESAKADLLEESERVTYPAPSPETPPPAAPAVPHPSHSAPSDSGVLRASEIFGKEGLHAYTEAQAFPISPVRKDMEAAYAAKPAPAQSTTYTASQNSARSSFAAPVQSTTYTAPERSADKPFSNAAPAQSTTYTAPQNSARSSFAAPAQPSAFAAPDRSAEADLAESVYDGEKPGTPVSVFSVLPGAADGTGASLGLDTSRVSDAAAAPSAIPPVTTMSIPHSTSSGAITEPSKDAVPYVYPPLSLLSPSPTVSAGSDDEIRENSRNLLDTLDSFNVKATIRHVSRGPRITRYELVPDKGVRIRAITNLQDDISMNLAAAGIRIEAPIPGLAAVGVEVPNSRSTTVCLRDMLDNESFRSATSKTTVCVGADVTGKPVYGDIGKMPHALIAGATGMGKSVCINTILLSLLYKAHPDEVKLILVDPKKVEFAPYNGIPHLLVPVVIEPQKAAGALVWAVGEMERRFNMIEQSGVRDIKGYNRIAASNPELGKPMPQIVIVIDELNDLMMSARDAVEDAICRIAQKARAAGIHLLIGTQRPSVDVITGVIKANIPSRMAFHVSSQVDSRTILDMTGAEKLLDKGDMLFFPVGAPKPIRVQGAFVTDEEVSAVTDFLKRSAASSYDDEVMANIEREAERCAPKDKRADRGGDDGFDGDGSDVFAEPQFVAAVEVALKLGQISTSKIQTKLRIGFQKASNYIEKMEELGIVGPPNGSKPRDVLINADQFLEMKARH